MTLPVKFIRFAITVAAAIGAIDIALPRTAHAGISIGDMHHYIDARHVTDTKQIYNSGDATVYVRVDVSEIDVRGNDIHRSGVDDIGDLVISPTRLIIPPGGSQTVRLIARGNRDAERYFRARFVPVTPVRAEGFDLSEQELATLGARVSTKVSVLIGYGAKVIVAPEKTTFATRVDSTPMAEVIHNGGNTTVFINELSQCKKKDASCEAPIKHRIGPGESLPLASTNEIYHTLELVEGQKKTNLIIGK